MATKSHLGYKALPKYDEDLERGERGRREGTSFQLGEGDVESCLGYKLVPAKLVLYVFLCVVSCGFLLLLSYWKPAWKLYLTCVQCESDEADFVFIHNNENEIYVEEVIEEFEEVARPVSVQCDSDIESNDEAFLINTKKQRVKAQHYFLHHHQRYLLDAQSNHFVSKNGLESMKCAGFHRLSGGLTTPESVKRRGVYGENVIDVQVKPYWKLLYQEVLDPFYVFQFASVIFWCADDYFYYAGAILFISCVSITLSLRQMRKHLVDLRNMVASPSVAAAIRDGVKVELLSNELVPGDVLAIPLHGMTMPCDAVLLTGTCRVNESMLTGESVPVNKTELPGKAQSTSSAGSAIYSSDRHKVHTLFCGTDILQARFYTKGMVLAVVTKTGFSTAKGGLVRAILFPKEVGFKFFRDALYFIGVLSIFALGGFTYSVIQFVENGVSIGQIIFRAFDLITTIVPPALPASMTVGIMYAVQRLKKRQIYCISPPKVNVSGKIKLICFDKTGTLTEDGLDFHGAIAQENNRLQFVVKDVALLPQGHLVTAMATCHELTIQNGFVSGDPLDVKMFEATDWIYEEAGVETQHYDQVIEGEVRHRLAPQFTITKDLLLSSEMLYPHFGILRRFPFVSDLQRMSVVVASLHDVNARPIAYVKGAPEMIARLCKPDTVPVNFHEELDVLTRRGYRVIAFAWKSLPVLRIRVLNVEREQVESDLHFVGLLVMQNKLKPETTPVINQLRQAAIRSVMVTGDNILTAVSVARECNIITLSQRIIMIEALENDYGDYEIRYRVVENPQPEESADEMPRSNDSGYQTRHTGLTPPRDSGFVFAITGKAFGIVHSHFPDVLDKLCVRGAVFARMLPEQKAQVVQAMQSLGYCICMCGDGANDCGALKTANAGISLSEAEASVASPFTSKVPNITCVPILIREGRAALATSFSVFKYMALYSMVEFVTVLMLYSIDSNLGDWQYLYIDLILVLIVALVMERTGASEHLGRRRPSGSLVSFSVLFSLAGQICIQIGAQVTAYYYLRSQTWFDPLIADPKSDNIECNENAVLFTVSCFQYIALAVAFSTGAPYRKPMYTNYVYLFSVIALTLLTIYMSIYPFEFLQTNILQLVLPRPMLFRIALLEIAGVAFVLSILFDHFIVPSDLVRRFWVKVRRKKGPKNRYKIVEKDISKDPCWPPLAND
eukprot:m.1935 g.1935  ORF g.1935 m.1935 type:complete len:1183 (+) comp8071_c0_seq2:157-3705(+)